MKVEYKWLFEIKGWKNMTIKDWLYEFYFMIRRLLKRKE